MRSTQTTSGTQAKKLSSLFASRIDNLSHREKIRAIVLLENSDARSKKSHSLSFLRRMRPSAFRRRHSGVLAAVDNILKRHGGARVSPKPNALGGIVVEATPAGILALAKSEHVKAIFEDQPVNRLK